MAGMLEGESFVMQCPRCRYENPASARLCGRCGSGLTLTCRVCGTELPASARFCLQCATPTNARTPSPTRPPAVTMAHRIPRRAEARPSTPKTLEGERKQVTVLFADLKGSMELLADRDPEEAR